MSPSVVHADLDVSKPPAAIAGSPGTTIVSVESLGNSAATFFLSDPSSGSRQLSSRDPIPPLWSFETSYTSVLGGGMIGTTPSFKLTSMPRTVPHQQHEHLQSQKEGINTVVKENGQALSSNWFGRKKDKVVKQAMDSSSNSRSERSKSVDPPSRTLYPAKSSLVSSSSTSPQGDILTPKPFSGMRSISISNVSGPPKFKSTSASTSNQIKTDPGPGPQSSTSSLPDPPPKTASHPGTSHVNSTTTPPHTRDHRPRHPPSSFNAANNGHPVNESGTGEKKKRPTTSSGTLTQQSTQNPSHASQIQQQAFLGEAFSLYGMAESHMSAVSSFTHYAPSHHHHHHHHHHHPNHDVPPSSHAPNVVSDPRGQTSVELLKRRIKAARTRGFTLRSGKRYHSQPRDEAPYPRDYDYQTLDFDEWTRVFELHLAKKCTFFPFTTEPKRVLDLGCGTGSWIVQCAHEWKNTTFVGLDIVPIQPDLTRIGNTSLAQRVEWVIGNFLKPLPFKDGDFDFVHVRRIARGVPENRWESLLDEITRVLKDGGAFEMVEEDLFFPGSVLCESKGRSSDEEPVESGAGDVDVESRNDSFKGEARPRPRVMDDNCAQADNNDLTSQFWDDEEDEVVQRKIGQTNIPFSSERQKSRMSMDVRPNRSAAASKGSLPGNQSGTPNPLFHPLINPIMNPRDHSILETAYNELHASRFINLLPLSLLSSMLVYHFKDVYTHEQTEVLFPKKSGRKTGLKKRSVSLHAPLSFPSSPAADSTNSNSNTTKLSASSRRKSYHSKISQSAPAAATDQATAKPPEVFFRPINMITDGVLRLPNDKWRFDERLLSMHLAIRVNEVLACAEEMWQFIQECQSDPHGWKNSSTAAFSGLTKEEWDDCLVRFRLDMQDKTGLEDLLRLPFPSGILPSPKKSNRKLFDEAVQRWETHRRQNDDMKGENQAKRPSLRRPISCSIRIFIARKE